MSQKTIISIIIVLAVVVGGYFLTRSSGDRAEGTLETSEQSTEGTEETGKKMAFADFMRGGGSYQCTVTHSADDVASEGTVYIDGDMVRSDYTSTTNGMTVDSHSIMRDGYSYSWSSLTPSGFKVALVDTSAQASGGASISGDFSSFDPNQIGDYECDPWTVDASVFAVPTDIEFTDMTELMPSGQMPLE